MGVYGDAAQWHFLASDRQVSGGSHLGLYGGRCGSDDLDCLCQCRDSGADLDWPCGSEFSVVCFVFRGLPAGRGNFSQAGDGVLCDVYRLRGSRAGLYSSVGESTHGPVSAAVLIGAVDAVKR